MKRKHLFKVVILGESGVGKTSLMNQFVNKQFTLSYKATVGADFMSQEVTLDEDTVTLQIWDTAGQERFQSLGGSFYKGSDCCVIVFDVTDPESFKCVEKWRNLFFTHCSVANKEEFPMVILANKNDLKSQRKVSEEEARKWQHEGPHIAYFQTSAKDSLNIEKAFQTVARFSLNRSLNEPKLIPQGVVLHKKLSSKKQGCC